MEDLPMNQRNKRNSSNREVKSSVFTTYFSDPENAAQIAEELEEPLESITQICTAIEEKHTLDILRKD